MRYCTKSLLFFYVHKVCANVFAILDHFANRICTWAIMDDTFLKSIHPVSTPLIWTRSQAGLLETIPRYPHTNQASVSLTTSVAIFGVFTCFGRCCIFSSQRDQMSSTVDLCERSHLWSEINMANTLVHTVLSVART